MKVKSESEVAQSCPALRDPMDYSLPGSSFHEIFQARVLEWGAIALSIELFNSPEVECFYEEPPFRTKSLLCGIYSRLPLANHVAFPDSESVFGLSR